jgi:hypothetical protein
MAYFGPEVTQNFVVLVSKPKIEIYDVMYIRKQVHVWNSVYNAT